MTGEEHIYNISNGVSQKFKDLINIAAQYIGTTSNVWDKLQKPDFHAVVQTKNVSLSNKKLAELGYKPEISMEDTLMDIIDDYRGKE